MVRESEVRYGSIGLVLPEARLRRKVVQAAAGVEAGSVVKREIEDPGSGPSERRGPKRNSHRQRERHGVAAAVPQQQQQQQQQQQMQMQNQNADQTPRAARSSVL
jgi:hypothetical protein